MIPRLDIIAMRSRVTIQIMLGSIASSHIGSATNGSCTTAVSRTCHKHDANRVEAEGVGKARCLVWCFLRGRLLEDTEARGGNA